MPSSTFADVSDIIFGTASLDATFSVAEVSSRARTLSFTEITSAEERKQAEYLFESFSVVD